KIVGATVGSDLRAGADKSRSDAELAFAQTALVRAEAARDVALAELREALGVSNVTPTLLRGHLDVLPQRQVAKAGTRDPRIAAARDRAQVADAKRREIETGTLPKLLLVADLWGRGNGLLVGNQGIADGLVPEIPNWSIGAVFTWPVFAGRL